MKRGHRHRCRRRRGARHGRKRRSRGSHAQALRSQQVLRPTAAATGVGRSHGRLGRRWVPRHLLLSGAMDSGGQRSWRACYQYGKARSDQQRRRFGSHRGHRRHHLTDTRDLLGTANRKACRPSTRFYSTVHGRLNRRPTRKPSVRAVANSHVRIQQRRCRQRHCQWPLRRPAAAPPPAAGAVLTTAPLLCPLKTRATAAVVGPVLLATVAPPPAFSPPPRRPPGSVMTGGG